MRFDAVKFVNHADDHPDDPVLRVRPLNAGELKALYSDLAGKLGLRPGTAPATILERLESALARVTGAHAEEPGFNPMHALAPALVDPAGELFFTLGDADDVWRMSVSDLGRYFDSVWYPGPDDLILVDPLARWAVGITHNGQVRIWTPSSPSQGLTS